MKNQNNLQNQGQDSIINLLNQSSFDNEYDNFRFGISNQQNINRNLDRHIDKLGRDIIKEEIDSNEEIANQNNNHNLPYNLNYDYPGQEEALGFNFQLVLQINDSKEKDNGIITSIIANRDDNFTNYGFITINNNSNSNLTLFVKFDKLDKSKDDKAQDLNNKSFHSQLDKSNIHNKTFRIGDNILSDSMGQRDNDTYQQLNLQQQKEQQKQYPVSFYNEKSYINKSLSASNILLHKQQIHKKNLGDILQLIK